MKIANSFSLMFLIIGNIGSNVAGESRSLRTDRSSDDCISQAEVDDIIQAFANAAVAIGDAYYFGPDVDPNDGNTNARDCAAAEKEARGALEGAYKYGQDGKVLFKPTLATHPYTYRNTLDGALSYFIGTECLKETGNATYPAHDDGFALCNNTATQNTAEGWAEVTWGVGAIPFASPFSYRLGGQNCQTVVAQGPMCFTSRWTDDKNDGEPYVACVDKSFTFNRNVEGDVVLSTHHSSVVM